MPGNGICRNMKSPYFPYEDNTPVEKVVMRFIKEKNSTTSKEIRQFLSSHGTVYEKMGMQKMLIRMEEEDKVAIDKSQKEHRFMPKMEKFPEIADLFGTIYSDVVHNLVFDTKIHNSTSTSGKEHVVDELIKNAGIYFLFGELQGWLYAQYGQNEKEKLDIKQTWDKGVLSYPAFSYYFSDTLKLLLAEDGIEFGRTFSNYKVKKKKILELIEVIKKNYTEDALKLLEITGMFDKKCLELKNNVSTKEKLKKTT